MQITAVRRCGLFAVLSVAAIAVKLFYLIDGQFRR